MTNEIEIRLEGHALSSGEDFQQWNVEACFAIFVRFKGEGGVENETYVLRFASFCELLRRPLNKKEFHIFIEKKGFDYAETKTVTT